MQCSRLMFFPFFLINVFFSHLYSSYFFLCFVFYFVFLCLLTYRVIRINRQYWLSSSNCSILVICIDDKQFSRRFFCRMSLIYMEGVHFNGDFNLFSKIIMLKDFFPQSLKNAHFLIVASQAVQNVILSHLSNLL